MDTQKKAFRKAFMGGFSKKDVNRYIEEASMKYTSEIEELRAHLASAEAENASLSEKLSSAEAEKSSLSEKLAELEGVKDELSSLRLEHNSLNERMAEKELSEKKLSEENAELSARVASLSRTESEYTARKAELAEIELSSRSRASELLAETEREITSKRAAFEAELSSRERAFADELSRKSSDAKDMCDKLSRLVVSLRGEVESMDSRLIRISEGARNNLSMLLNAVNDAETKVSDIGGVITSLDNK